MIINLRKLFGIKPKQKKPYEFADVLHMWEDDHLMIELFPKDNVEFIKKESNRIELVSGWKVEVARECLNRFERISGAVLEDLEEKWAVLFAKLIE
ncbi:hypothetical protein [Crocinitomix catalasitica]|uniref:hypothetical protein n=1 Tax=Crocinitomix catalasitica TaxID=184607 RepID=UPI000481978E|nr:hypothetical protein [Crocinitomix catalasitica]